MTTCTQITTTKTSGRYTITTTKDKLIFVESSCKQCGIEKVSLEKGKLKACSGCFEVRYCSRECQKLDWKIHKLQCENLQRRYVFFKMDSKENMGTKIQTTKLSIKMQLAEFFTKGRGLPNECLRDVFDDLMPKFEKIHNTNFSSALKDRVYTKISERSIETLEHYMLSDFCTKTLGCFNEEEATEMVAEITESGALEKSKYVTHFKTTFIPSDLCNSVQGKAESMKEELSEAILNTLKEELERTEQKSSMQNSSVQDEK